MGLDPVALDAALKTALATEATSDKDLAVATPAQFRSEAPYNNLLGPTQVRAGGSALVIYKGHVVATAGDIDRADMTFSVTKTFLSTVVGEAFERGLIKDLNDKVGPYMPAGVDLFKSEHNAKITWDHLLRQTSDWYGTLWGKPDWADRPQNCLGPGIPVPNIEQCKDRPLREPGTAYKYNDTRVNVLALATLYLFKEPLPAVLKREIMDPIGASSAWHWEPYENAYVTIDGKRMPSIPGGGHHGGGMFISAWDMARFGYLFLNNGKWNGRQLVTEGWIAKARTPGVNPGYGFMNWMLNANRPNRVSFQGNGPNTIYIDWNNDLVVVTRWLGGGNAFVDAVVAAIQK
jgi:CubicO group peptidase (beta-lactamase class C family)